MEEEQGRRADSSAWRGPTFTVMSFVFGAAALGGLFGIGIVIGWFDDELGGIHRVHDIGFGVTYGALTATAFFALMWRRGRRASILWQIAAVAGGVIVASLVSADFGYAILGVILVVALAILVALWPERTHVLPKSIAPSVFLVTAAVISAVPLTWAALTWARYQRDGSPIDPHVAQSHWTTMSSMALALLLASALASARLSGWRFTAWCAAVGTAAYGVASIVFSRFPGTESPYPGSEGVPWGIAAVVGGIGFAALAEWEARRGAVDADHA
jgi:predicted outer membrane lipoprotein